VESSAIARRVSRTNWSNVPGLPASTQSVFARSFSILETGSESLASIGRIDFSARAAGRTFALATVVADLSDCRDEHSRLALDFAGGDGGTFTTSSSSSDSSSMAASAWEARDVGCVDLFSAPNLAVASRQATLLTLAGWVSGLRRAFASQRSRRPGVFEDFSRLDRAVS
jgi:hypothetical protein